MSRRSPPVLVPIAVSLCASAVSFSLWFEGGLSHEFCHYAEIGRNLLGGRGFSTAAVYPAALAVLDSRGIPFGEGALAPVLDRFPLQAVLTASAQSVMGASDAAVFALCAFLLAVLAASTAWLARAMRGPEEGLLAGLLVALNPSLQRGFVLWGLPDLAFCLLALAAAWTLAGVVSRRSTPAGSFAGAGALAGLAFLARSNLLVWLPLYAWLVLRRGTWRGLASYLAGFAAVCAPFWAHSLAFFGSLTPPTASWNLAHHVVQDSLPWLSYRVFPVSESLRHASELGRKFLHLLGLQLADLPFLWQLPFLLPLAAFGAWQARSKPFVRLILGMLLLHVLAFSFLRHETLGPHARGRYLLWLLPAACLLGLEGARAAGRRLGVKRPGPARAAFAASLAVYAAYWAIPQGPAAHPSGRPVDAWPELAAAAGASRGGVTVTNLAPQLAWYHGRPAIALPSDPGDYLRIAGRHKVSAVLISRLGTAELEATPAWKPVLDDPAVRVRFLKAARLRFERDLKTAVLFVAAPAGRP